jgi:hypothetical protein
MPIRSLSMEATSEPAPKPAVHLLPLLQQLRSALPPPLQGRLQSARELARTHAEAERQPFPTAWPAFDRLLAGGLPRGGLLELHGGRSCGRFSAVLTALAAATGVGEAAALVDLGDHLDPAAAASMGVDLERLLWLRPESVRHALAATEMLIGGGFPLVVVELGNPPLPGSRGAESSWLRLARAAQAQGTALLVSSPYRVSGTAATAVLRAGGARAAWHGEAGGPRLLQGISSRLDLEKRRGATISPAAETATAASAITFTLAASPLPPANRLAPAHAATNRLAPAHTATSRLAPGADRLAPPASRLAPARPRRLAAAV